MQTVPLHLLSPYCSFMGIYTHTQISPSWGWLTMHHQLRPMRPGPETPFPEPHPRCSTRSAAEPKHTVMYFLLENDGGEMLTEWTAQSTRPTRRKSLRRDSRRSLTLFPHCGAARSAPQCCVICMLLSVPSGILRMPICDCLGVCKWYKNI